MSDENEDKAVKFKLIAGLKKKGLPKKKGEDEAKKKLKKSGLRSLLSW